MTIRYSLHLLCIKYPDRVGIDDFYELKLYGLVAQGDDWEYVLFRKRSLKIMS
jgi:hypothetical protein